MPRFDDMMIDGGGATNLPYTPPATPVAPTTLPWNVTSTAKTVPLADAVTQFTSGSESVASAKAAAAAKPVEAKPAVTYRVKPGDTVSEIAAANGMTTKELLAINPALTNNPKYNGGSTIFSNTKIVLEPAVKGTGPAKPAGVPQTPVVPETPVTPTEEKPTEEKPTEEKPVEEKPVEPAGGGNQPVVPAGNAGVDNAAMNAVLEQITTLTQQLADLQAKQAAEAAKPKAIGVKTVRKTGGVVETVEIMSDGSQGKVIDSYKDFGAKDAVSKMFANAGLGQTFIDSLTATIDKVYDENIMPTDEQILNSIYSSDAYKTRFAANEAIRKRMAEGKGMPGDRLLTPAEYIKTEDAYREVLQTAGLPVGFYDTQDDFTKLIENSISTAELTERVNIASQALQNADKNIVDALKSYYGMSTGDLTAYLLDKDKAFNVLNSRYQYTTEEAKKMYGAAEIGGAAGRAGMDATKGFAEEIYSAGKGAMAEQAFQSASRQQEDYKRLLGLYGQEAGQEDLAREALALAGGTDVSLRTKKLASKERAKFATRSAIDRTSLGRATAADV
jgi:LysM repeat protein